jgi:hypothetical protein
MERSGKCLCGAVTYQASGVDPKVGICHCGMCRRWVGGPFVSVSAETITWSGDEHIKTFTSSPWAERAFCSTCGSSLFYRVTAPGKHQGLVVLLFGTLDDPTGLTLEHEWFIDRKPDCYAIAGEHPRKTESEVMAMFGASAS